MSRPGAPNFPSTYSDWWADRAARHFHLKDPKAAVRRLAQAAGDLSDRFTIHRDLGFASLYEKPEPLLAYGNYFLPQTYVRSALILWELLFLHQWTPPDPCHFLDLGSGSGGASRAAIDLIPSIATATLVDQSEPALALAQEFLAAAPHPPLNILHADLVNFIPPRKDYGLIIASFSLSELPDSTTVTTLCHRLHDLGEHLHPSGLMVIIEPALAITTETLHAARVKLINLGSWIKVWAPCLHRGLGCPLLAEGRFFCHEVRPWKVPPHVQRINATLHRSVWDLKFSFLVFGRTAPIRPVYDESLFRLVSPISKETGKYRFRGCTASGTLAEYDLLRRSLTPLQRRELERLHRGRLFRLSNLLPLKTPHHYRVGSPEELLTPEVETSVVQPPQDSYPQPPPFDF
ncbi:MAG: small ribosomal subunit Rsm22 family protein [Verrucomicrobiia bacterium]